MKFFNTSLDDIYEIVSDKDTILFSSENNQQQWIEETQDYEDVRLTLRRALIDHFDEYKTFRI